MSTSRATIVLLVALAFAACTVRLGGPRAEAFQTLALVPGGAGAEDIASRIRGADGRLVLLVADRDSAWFADVAQRSGLALSGPGRTGPRGLGFLTRGVSLLGDTSLVLGVPGGGAIHMHDALFEIGRNRMIDLMAVDLRDLADLREGARTLLGYIATDVGNNVPLVLAIHASAAGVADSVSALLRAAFRSAAECAAAAGADGTAAAPAELLFGPPVRIRCETAGRLQDGIQARLMVLR